MSQIHYRQTALHEFHISHNNLNCIVIISTSLMFDLYHQFYLGTHIIEIYQPFSDRELPLHIPAFQNNNKKQNVKRHFCIQYTYVQAYQSVISMGGPGQKT